MKYRVLGKHITKIYDVRKYGDKEKGFSSKPAFIYDTFIEWDSIFEFECERIDNYELHNTCGMHIGYQTLNLKRTYPNIYISEDEAVYIECDLFRADQCITYLQTTKVLSEKEDKETNTQKYQEALQEYYDYVIEKYPKVKEYIEMHEVKDVLENIDKIKKIIYKENEYCLGESTGTLYAIKNGVKLAAIDIKCKSN